MSELKVEIRKSFYEAFVYFLRALRYERLNFIVEDIPIPVFIAKNNYLVPTSWKEATASFKAPFLLMATFLSFAYYWIVFSRDVTRVLGILRHESRFIADMARKIPDYTHCEWEYSKVSMYPVIGKWAASRFDKLYVGITPVSISDHERRWIIVHELIHMNVHGVDRKGLGAQSTDWNLVDELAVVVVTRSIQKDVPGIQPNDLQALTIPLRDIISEKDLVSLEAVAKRGASFRNILTYCGELLSKIESQ